MTDLVPRPRLAAPERERFRSLDPRPLDWDSVPLRLFGKGHRRAWDPSDIDFSRDAEDWRRLPETARDALAGLCAMFTAGEEAVTHDLQPFLAAMAAEGRLGDEMYLTQFCYEEARHTEVFRRWLDAVGETRDLNHHVAGNPGYRTIFHEELPRSLNALTEDPCPANQVRASVTYNHIVEGTLALTGYFAWNRMCARLGLFPGMREIIRRIGDDERRHMAWGTYTCRRHVAADEANWLVARRRMRELLPHAIRQIQFATHLYQPEYFGLEMRALMTYATGRAKRRLAAIEAARGKAVHLVEVDTVTERLEDAFAEEDAATAEPVRTG